MRSFAVALLWVLLAGCAPAPGAPVFTPEPSAAALLAGSIANENLEPWYPYLSLTNGQPDVQLIDGSTYVFFGPATTSDIANAACNSIKELALAMDPNSATPLGLTSIVISVGGNNAAHCYPPAPALSAGPS